MYQTCLRLSRNPDPTTQLSQESEQGNEKYRDQQLASSTASSDVHLTRESRFDVHEGGGCQVFSDSLAMVVNCFKIILNLISLGRPKVG